MAQKGVKNKVVESESANDARNVSRRDFLVRAAQVGATLSVVSPGLARFLRAPATAAAVFPSLADLAPLYSGLHWRLIGPFRGGRCAAACGVPGRPNEFYFGSVNGGVWKSIDAGRVWAPVFDSQPVASIGAITVAPSAPDVVYVGTGESTLRDSAGYGDGMYKSIDAGKTWQHIGLGDTQHIGKIAVDPKNPDVLFVAAIGHLYAPSTERGVFKSTDGGKSWKKVLFRNADVGAVEVVIDPTDSRIVYAGLWNTRRPPWFTYAPTNGPGGGIFKSTDGGESWVQLTSGLPTGTMGRTGIAVSPSNPKRVYAIVDCLTPNAKPTKEPPIGTPAPAPQPVAARVPAETPEGQGGFFRSDDAGVTWTKLSADQALWGRGWYFEKVTVDPKNADIVYVPNVAVNRSMDGGKSWVALRGSPGGDDYHQAWVSPDDPDTMIVASDQGAIVTRNARAIDSRDVTWSSWLNQPTAQLYHLSIDPRFPYWVTAAQQDSGAVAVRSRGKFAEISMRDWEPIGAGGESGYTAADVLNPGIIFGGMGTRYNLETNTPIEGTVAPKPTGGETMRADWTQPLVFSKADPHALYYASQFLFKTSDGAKSWQQISPDLTRANAPAPPTLDATAAAQVDRNGKRGVIYTIAPSPVRAQTIWIGTDDGLVHITRDDGKTWSDVTPVAVTPWSRVTMIDASHFDERAAYVSVDRHQLQDFDPYIYRTRDAGKSWQRIVTGLPRGVYVHVVKEDPRRRGLLVAGTERGAYFSIDDGDLWRPLQLNLPVTSVRDFEFYENDLVVATHGRGFWIIDDVTPLRQLDSSLLAKDVHLFKPADSINEMQGGDNGTPLQKDEPQAENAPVGATIDYYLRSAATGPVTLDILDATGAVIFTYSSVPGAGTPTAGRRGRATGGIPNTSALWRTPPATFPSDAGMHRVVWLPFLRPAPNAPPDEDGRPARGKAVTGNFVARLTVAGRTYSEPFTVKPDPRLRQS